MLQTVDPQIRKIAEDQRRSRLKKAYRKRLPFGVHKGKSLKAVADEDVLYLDWLNGIDVKRRDLLTAIALICEDRKAQIDAAIEEQEEREIQYLDPPLTWEPDSVWN